MKRDYKRDHRPQTADQRPETTDRRPQTADQRPETTDRRPQTVDQRLRIAILAAMTLVCCLGIFMSSPVFAADEPIVIDHTNIQEFEQIPNEYIEAVKEMTLHFVTSGGGLDIIWGLYLLDELYGSDYNIYLEIDGEEVEEPGGDPAFRMSIEMGASHEYYWSTENGKANTRAFADSGDYNYSIWVWDDLDYTDYEDNFVQNYLLTLHGFEQDYPNMRFIYMTRYVIDRQGIADSDNGMIRAYCEANNKVLFDLEDIVAHQPPYDLSLWGGDEDAYLDDMYIMRAKAFWVMMARLAGWSSDVVHDRMLGDVDGDGEITAYIDARLAARHGVGLYTLEGDALWAADVDGDREITAYLDARLIARRALGLIDKFPIE